MSFPLFVILYTAIINISHIIFKNDLYTQYIFTLIV